MKGNICLSVALSNRIEEIIFCLQLIQEGLMSVTDVSVYQYKTASDNLSRNRMIS